LGGNSSAPGWSPNHIVFVIETRMSGEHPWLASGSLFSAVKPPEEAPACVPSKPLPDAGVDREALAAGLVAV